MASYSYTYSISEDFPNQKTDPLCLDTEIFRSAIVIASQGVHTSGDVCTITFKTALSNDDKTLLDTIVAAHSGTPLSSAYTPSYTRDGRALVLPSTMADNAEVQFIGSGDDIENGLRGKGTDFKVTLASAGSQDITFQFKEPIDIAGGGAVYHNANIGDYIHYEIFAPATVGTLNEGAGAFDKFNLGGAYNMYTPNATQEGDWDLDLSESLNANVSFTKAVPVPAPANDGFFDYDRDANILRVNSVQTGEYNLFDFDLPLARFIHKNWILGSRHNSLIVPASYGAKKLLPQWKHKISITHVGEGTVDLTWYLFISRDSTQPE